MSDITYDDLDRFYAESYRVIDPQGADRVLRPWQKELARRVADGDVPEAVTAPTGAGKTFIAALHVFRCAVDTSAPARLIVVIPRRTLVDSVRDEVAELIDALESDDATPLMRKVRDRLLSRKQSRIDGKEVNAPCAAAVSLRGGQRRGKRTVNWQDEPNMCTVITATPEVAISTVLFNSYLFRPSSHALNAGLFAIDAHVVFDEAHMQRQAVTTYRSVERLVNSRDDRRLTVTEMTATPPRDAPNNPLGVTSADLDDESTRRVLLAPKTVSTVGVTGKDTVASTASREALSLRDNVNGTVAVVVNTVADARAVATTLRKAKKSVITITGRSRTADRERILGEHPDVLTTRGDDSVDFAVATQTIEVGIDADFAGMVSALAPGDALAQRFGRVNRKGMRPEAPVVVVCPPLDGKPTEYLPYRIADLESAMEWLDARISDNGDISPVAVSESRPPVPAPRRAVLHKLHHADAHNLSVKCGYAPSVYDDPSFWCSDDLEETPTTRVVLRRALPDEWDTDTAREELLSAFRPTDSECWTVPAHVAGKVLEKLQVTERVVAVTQINAAGSTFTDIPVNGDVSWSYNTVVLWVRGAVPVLLENTLDASGTETAAWVDESEVLDGGALFMRDDVPEPTSEDRAQALSAWGTRDDAPWWYAARRVCGDSHAYVVLSAITDKDGKPLWALVLPTRPVDEDARSHGQVKVELDSHRSDVAEACRSLAATLRPADAEFQERHRLAGLFHDDGKGHRGFQEYLARRRNYRGKVLAKSGNPITYSSRKTDYGLPAGWRHEQLSAAIAARELKGTPHRESVTLLAGFSHGYGRAVFPHSYSTLIAGDTDSENKSEDIFTDGTWDEWLHDTTRRVGPWHFAWEEALVRAADHHVSAQNH